MKYYFAPLEGITGYTFRNTFQEYFGGIDKWFTPFLAPNHAGGVRTREINDVLPAHNTDIHVVPQILTNHAPSFLITSNWLKEQGYEEINLNLGCPSGTVVAKKKGSGFLAEPMLLEKFLDEIYSGFSGKISIKTRIGKDSAEEFPELLEIYNKFPVAELIVHPRVQTDYYKNTPDWDMFAYAVQHAKMPLCYNGDLFTTGDLRAFREKFPDNDTIMIGRGLLANPALIARAEGKPVPSETDILRFHDTLVLRYQEIMPGERALLFKMKELWVYFGTLFMDCDKYLKKIRKAQKLSDYQRAVNDIFAQCEMLSESTFCG